MAPLRERSFVALALAIVAGLYAAPFIGVALEVAGTGLVPLLDADTYLYAVISRQPVGVDGLVENAWYGTRLPADEVTYLRFGKALVAYGLLERAAGGLALPIWTGAGSLLIAIGAYALARRVMGFPRAGAAVAMLFVTLVNLRYDAYDLAALWHGIEHASYHYGLPFRRPFFPQVGVVIALAYLALFPSALTSGSTRLYAALAVVQFLGVLTFPYATALCAVTSALVAALMGMRRIAFPLRPLLVFGACCAVADLAYVAAGPALHGLGTGGEPLLQWDPTWLTLRDLHGLLAITVAASLACRAPSPVTRFTLIGFAASIALLSWSDSVFLTLQLGVHVKYFVSLAAALLLLLLASEAVHRFPGLSSRAALAAAAFALVAWGTLQSTATFRHWQPVNATNLALAAKLRELRPGPGDLVVEPVPAFLSRRPPPYWESSPVPLVSQARTLLTSGARFLLSPGEVGVHLDREATYLYLAGHDEQSLRTLLQPADPPTPVQFFLAGYGREFPLLGARRAEILGTIAQELQPRLRRLLDGGESGLRAGGRVVVFDLARAPTFRAERLDQLFETGAPFETGPWIVREGTVRARHAAAR